MTDSSCNIIDIIVITGADIDSKLYFFCYNIHSSRNGFHITHCCNSSICFFSCPVTDFRNNFCCGIYRIFPHIHWGRSCMICPSMNRNHISLNSNNAVYKTDFCILCIKYRSLFNMRLHKIADSTFFPCCFFDFFRNQTILLHGIINSNSICICIILCVLCISVSKHRTRAKISCSKTHSFFIAESDCYKVPFRYNSFFF